MQQKIVLIGAPGSGKTSVLNNLIKKGYSCMPEISRAVTLKAQEEGIEQLFLSKPLLFSEMLLEGREKQYIQAKNSENEIIFFDRGIPSITAYLDYFETSYPEKFLQKNKEYNYTKIFQFLPWEKIYTSDNERYETFNEAKKISSFLTSTYTKLGYNIITVPFGTIEERTQFIIEKL